MKYFLAVLALAASLSATVLLPANCTQATVQASINSAVDGDTVLVPPGACSWNNLNWSDKNITFLGSGNTSNPAVSTIITSAGLGAIQITLQSKAFRISNFRFLTGVGVLDVIIVAQSSGALDTKINGIRIDNNYFDDLGHGGNFIDLTGRVYGVADHNYFAYLGGVQIGLVVQNGIGETDTNLAALSGSKSWARASTLGTADAWYYEDNTIDSQVWPTGNLGDGTAGQRFVVRHNKFIGGWAEEHGAYSRGSRGSMQWEIYDNDFIPYTGIGGTAQYQAIKLRGGSGVIFSNRFHGAWDASGGPIYFDNERSRDALGHAPLNSRCNGTATGIDNNTGFMGYPCLDQIGRGTGSMGALTSLPALEWNNNLCTGYTVNGACASPVATHPKIDPDSGTRPFQSDHIQQNRDWCTPSCSGNSCAATCNGVAEAYTAFTYPHPLITSSGNAPDDTLVGPNPGWSECDLGNIPSCNPGGTGIPVGVVQTINNVSPSLDGASMRFGFTSAAGGATNVLWPYKYAGNDLANTFSNDFWFYSAEAAVIGQFEFDTFLFSKSENIEFMFGTQCNITTGKWQIWGNGWIDVAPTLPCSVTASAWHHITETFHRVPGEKNQCAGQACMYFDRITIDGVPHDIAMKEPAAVLPSGWTSAVGFQFQLNIPGANTFGSEYVDLVTFSAQQAQNPCP